MRRRKKFPDLERRERAIRERHDPPCPNCGQPGRHFMPPSMGDRGFYVCGEMLRLRQEGLVR